MASLGFVFEARFHEPLQPEDSPPTDARSDSPKLVTTRPASVPARDPVPDEISEGELYRAWQEECRRINEEIRVAYEAYMRANEEAKQEIARIQENVRQLRADWMLLRATPKPPQPASKRRR